MTPSIPASRAASCFVVHLRNHAIFFEILFFCFCLLPSRQRSIRFSLPIKHVSPSRLIVSGRYCYAKLFKNRERPARDSRSRERHNRIVHYSSRWVFASACAKDHSRALLDRSKSVKLNCRIDRNFTSHRACGANGSLCYKSNAHPPHKQGELLYINSSARVSKFLLDRLGFVFADTLFYRLRSAIDQVLGFFQA